ncbi:MAG: hypothetical protein ACD_73C00769G0009 [uncultured bacterium]|nr:MAG: hypothetical protein ACD_73C00769G0009 [uncultured bacterium]
MDFVHLHLIVNHFPVVAVILGTLFFIISLLAKCEDSRKLSLMLWVVAAFLVGPAYFSGEEAEETLEHEAWFEEGFVEHHAEKGELAMIAALVLGVGAAAGLYFIKRKNSFPKPLAAGLLILSLGTSYLIADAANHGGQIRHLEIRDSGHQHSPVGGEHHEHSKGDHDDHD